MDYPYMRTDRGITVSYAFYYFHFNLAINRYIRLKKICCQFTNYPSLASPKLPVNAEIMENIWRCSILPISQTQKITSSTAGVNGMSALCLPTFLPFDFTLFIHYMYQISNIEILFRILLKDAQIHTSFLYYESLSHRSPTAVVFIFLSLL